MLSFKSSRLFQVQWTDFVECDVSVASKEREKVMLRRTDAKTVNLTMGIGPRTPTKRQHNNSKQTHSQRVIKSPANELPACVWCQGVCVVVRVEIMRGLLLSDLLEASNRLGSPNRQRNRV